MYVYVGGTCTVLVYLSLVVPIETKKVCAIVDTLVVTVM